MLKLYLNKTIEKQERNPKTRENTVVEKDIQILQNIINRTTVHFIVHLTYHYLVFFIQCQPLWTSWRKFVLLNASNQNSESTPLTLLKSTNQKSGFARYHTIIQDKYGFMCEYKKDTCDAQTISFVLRNNNNNCISQVRCATVRDYTYILLNLIGNVNGTGSS